MVADEHCCHNSLAVARKRSVECSVLKVELAKMFLIHRLKPGTTELASASGRGRKKYNIPPEFTEMPAPLRITIFFFVSMLFLTADGLGRFMNPA